MCPSGRTGSLQLEKTRIVVQKLLFARSTYLCYKIYGIEKEIILLGLLAER